MERKKLGGFPFESRTENGKTILRFYPKGENAKNPNGVIFVLSLNKDDITQIKKIIS